MELDATSRIDGFGPRIVRKPGSNIWKNGGDVEVGLKVSKDDSRNVVMLEPPMTANNLGSTNCWRKVLKGTDYDHKIQHTTELFGISRLCALEARTLKTTQYDNTKLKADMPITLSLKYEKFALNVWHSSTSTI